MEEFGIIYALVNDGKIHAIMLTCVVVFSFRLLSWVPKELILDFVKRKFWNNKNTPTEKAKKYLKEHLFFTRLKEYKGFMIDRMVFHKTNEVRNKMVIDFIKIKISEYIKTFEVICFETDVESMDKKSFKKLIIDSIHDTWTRYDSISLKEWVPWLFIEKYNKKREDLAYVTIERIKDYCDSDNFDTNLITLMRILDALVFIFGSVITDAQHTISSINGELSDLQYKWQIIWK